MMLEHGHTSHSHKPDYITSRISLVYPYQGMYQASLLIARKAQIKQPNNMSAMAGIVIIPLFT